MSLRRKCKERRETPNPIFNRKKKELKTGIQPNNEEQREKQQSDSAAARALALYAYAFPVPIIMTKTFR